MKDIFGEEIKLGNHVIYIQSRFSNHFEKAVVVESQEDFIKIQYLGVSSYPLEQYCKVKGKKGRITATDKKIAIMECGSYDKKSINDDITKRFHDAIEKIEKKLKNALEREKLLIKKNEGLMKEVDKIHNRFDILDL